MLQRHRRIKGLSQVIGDYVSKRKGSCIPAGAALLMQWACEGVYLAQVGPEKLACAISEPRPTATNQKHQYKRPTTWLTWPSYFHPTDG